jgi:hypothetical protein
MLLPRALLDAVLFRGVSRLLVAILIVSDLARLPGELLPIVLILLALLSMLRAGLCLFVLSFFLGVIPLIVLLFVLRIQRYSDSEKQRQNACADHSTCLHM